MRAVRVTDGFQAISSCFGGLPKWNGDSFRGLVRKGRELQAVAITLFVRGKPRIEAKERTKQKFTRLRVVREFTKECLCLHQRWLQFANPRRFPFSWPMI